jgi:thiamine-phosphate pyrophosphorylase
MMEPMPEPPILCYVTDRRALAPRESSAGGAETPAGGTKDAQANARSEILLERIGAAARAGVDWIQIREKDLTARALSALVRRGLEAVAGAARVIVNDRLDIAVAAGAGGVHLGRESLPAEAVVPWVRARFGEATRAGLAARKFLVGVSTHSLAEAEAAARAGADYIFFGPVFATPAKLQFGPPQGIERLAAVCRAIGSDCAVIAIGGVTRANAADCFAAGAAGIAAIRMFQDAAVRGELPSLCISLRGVRPSPRGFRG